MAQIRRLAVLAILAICLQGCGGGAERRGEATNEGHGQQEQIQRLARYLTGTFSSQKQADEDSDYLSVGLAMQPIWTDRTDGSWLYVEQIVTGAQEPYRQRIYRLSANTPGTLRSDTFELPDPAAFVGAWRHPESFLSLTPAALNPNEGCALVFTYDPRSDVFAGATNGTNCTSVLRGASFATSTAEISKNEILSWDRGFDVKGHQVWGPKKGAYRYDRVTAFVEEPVPAADDGEPDGADAATPDTLNSQPQGEGERPGAGT